MHGARVSFKKIRAVLRLAYGELGREIYKRENIEYRDAGRRLATARDTEVVAATLGDYSATITSSFRLPILSRFESVFADRGRNIGSIASGSMPGVAEAVRSARQRVEAWPIENDGFSALSTGLKRIYKRGRDGFLLTGAERTTENLHEWRKQVKYLWYQVCILNPMWPKPLDVLAYELSKLADYLSEDHDLALLTRTAIEQATELSAPDEVENLILLIDQRRIQLQAKAAAIGARLYAENSKAFVNRMQFYWEAWRPGTGAQPAEDPQMDLVFEAASGSSN